LRLACIGRNLRNRPPKTPQSSHKTHTKPTQTPCCAHPGAACGGQHYRDDLTTRNLDPMKNLLAKKCLFIAAIALFLLIPLSYIEGIIVDRTQRHSAVLDELAQSGAAEQEIIGPILVVPYSKLERTEHWDNAAQKFITTSRKVNDTKVFIPKRLQIDGSVATHLRQRGIYSVPLYTAQLPITGEFVIPKDFGIADSSLADYTFGAPYVAVAMTDVRGLQKVSPLVWNNAQKPFMPGSRLAVAEGGINAELTLNDIPWNQPVSFSVALAVNGSQSLQLAPVGEDNRILMAANWPHPSFFGDYLPSEKTITDTGFNAQWQTSIFATNYYERLIACEQDKNCGALKSRFVGVKLLDPTSHYVKSERAVKYALLFITLTFAAFFIIEVLKQQSLHPAQYLLVGFALAIFYLLLISLSEHLGFNLAYGLSALACSSLVAYYLAQSLGQRAMGTAFFIGLNSLYALLFGILRSEDYALLMGSLLLFAVLAAVMYSTRRLDWQHSSPAPAAKTSL
jgi:inner membrane protein